MRIVNALLLAAVVIHWQGCSDEETAAPVTLPTTSKVVATLVKNQVVVQFPADWEEQSVSDPFDSLWTYDPYQLTTGLFVYTSFDNSDLSPNETLQFHVDQIESNHSDFKIVRERSDTPFGPKNLATLVCSGVTSSGEEAYYRLTLVEFTGHTRPFVVVVQGCAPDIFEQAEPVFQQITESFRPTESAGHPVITAPSNPGAPSFTPSGTVE